MKNAFGMSSANGIKKGYSLYMPDIPETSICNFDDNLTFLSTCVMHMSWAATALLFSPMAGSMQGNVCGR